MRLLCWQNNHRPFYLQNVIGKETWAFLANNRLVNPFLVLLSKMANLNSHMEKVVIDELAVVNDKQEGEFHVK